MTQNKKDSVHERMSKALTRAKNETTAAMLRVTGGTKTLNSDSYILQETLAACKIVDEEVDCHLNEQIVREEKYRDVVKKSMDIVTSEDGFRELANIKLLIEANIVVLQSRLSKPTTNSNEQV